MTATNIINVKPPPAAMPMMNAKGSSSSSGGAWAADGSGAGPAGLGTTGSETGLLVIGRLLILPEEGLFVVLDVGLSVGSDVGLFVGSDVNAAGFPVGGSVIMEGIPEGILEAIMEGAIDSASEGEMDGERVSVMDGERVSVGVILGTSTVGEADKVGTRLVVGTGDTEGGNEVATEGMDEGEVVGNSVSTISARRIPLMAVPSRW